MTCTGPLARHASGSPAPRVPAAACCPAAPASPVGQARVIMKPALFSPPPAGPPSPPAAAKEAIVMTARRALVTGSSRGIGAAIARALAGSGHRVAVHCRADTAAAGAVAASLPAAAGLPGGGHAVVTGDIADPRQAADLVGAAVAALGGI